MEHCSNFHLCLQHGQPSGRVLRKKVPIGKHDTNLSGKTAFSSANLHHHAKHFSCLLFLRTFYYLRLSLSNSKLLYLLEQLSSLVTFVDPSKNTAFLVSAVFVQQFFFVISSFYVFFNISKFLPFLIIVIQYITLHTLHINANMTFFLVFYYKYTTLKALQKVASRFNSTGNFEELESKVVYLASINQQLNRIISLPYIFSLVPYIVQIIVAFTCLLIEQTSDTNSFAIGYLSYNTIIIIVCNAIDGQLKAIQCLILKHRQKRQEMKTFFKMTSYAEKLHSGNNHNDDQCLKWNEFMSLYEKCFQLRIFNFFTVNWRFVLLLSLQSSGACFANVSNQLSHKVFKMKIDCNLENKCSQNVPIHLISSFN